MRRTLEKSVLIQFLFGFSLVSLSQYSALAVFLRRTRTIAREVTIFLVFWYQWTFLSGGVRPILTYRP